MSDGKISLDQLPLDELSRYLEINPPALPYSSLVGYPAAGYLPYTPVFSDDGTGSPTLGNGTITARFARFQNLVHCYGEIILGSTTSFGNNFFNLSLPTMAKRWGLLVPKFPLGSALASVGAGVWFLAPQLSGDSQIEFMGTTVVGGGARFVCSTGAPFPGAWASGDRLNWNTIYEAV